MIYDITDIINDTHQFSCLIEGGCGAYPGTTKGHCPENVEKNKKHHPSTLTRRTLRLLLFLFPSLFLLPAPDSHSSSSATVSLRFHLSGLLENHNP